YGDGNIFLPRLIKTHSYINVAKMKTHMSTSVTLSMKNQKGLLLLKDKKGFHLGYGENTDLHSCIVRLSQIVKPELAMVDGTRALEGSGPTTAPEGLTNVRRLDLCVMGKDMIEVDNACCKIMGFDIKSVKHIPEVPVRLSKCSLPLATVKPPLKKPGNVLKIGNLRLHISKWMCTGCQMAYSRMIRKIMYSKELSKKFQILQKKEPVINMYMGKSCLALIEDARKRTGDKKPRIFFGTCATQASQDLEGIHISGCPPDYRKATKKIISLVDSNGEF
ncbi:MAG TPA: DUF362 domain-containing protein, partial [Patescibacteria group bacterium]|nr:DUF362 domain-containing protein [Patescibacteria group bacterium]